MNIIPLLAAGTFSIGTYVEPIHQEKWLTYEVTDGASRMGLYCQPSTTRYEVRAFPEGFKGRSIEPLARAPIASSRFPNAAAPVEGWVFEANHLTFDSSWELKTKARFIDDLAKNTSIAIRFWDGASPVTTVTIEYNLDPAELRSFMAQCGPKKVNRYLTEWGSPAAPEQK